MSVGDAISHGPGCSHREERDGMGRDPEYGVVRERSYSRDGRATLSSLSECPSEDEGRRTDAQDEKGDGVVVSSLHLAAVAIGRVDEEALQQQPRLTSVSASPRRTSNVSPYEAEEVSLRQRARCCRHCLYSIDRVKSPDPSPVWVGYCR